MHKVFLNWRKGLTLLAAIAKQCRKTKKPILSSNVPQFRDVQFSRNFVKV